MSNDIQTGTNYFILAGSPTCVVSFVHSRQIPNSEGRCEPIVIFVSNGTYVNSTRKVVFLLSRFQEKLEILLLHGKSIRIIIYRYICE